MRTRAVHRFTYTTAPDVVKSDWLLGTHHYVAAFDYDDLLAAYNELDAMCGRLSSGCAKMQAERDAAKSAVATLEAELERIRYGNARHV